MCSKKFCVQAKGGGHRPVPPPLNTPLIGLAVFVALTSSADAQAGRIIAGLTIVSNRRTDRQTSRALNQSIIALQNS